MRRHYLDQYGKPILWPAPADCLWRYGRFETGGAVTISAQGGFDSEARLLAGALEETGLLRASLSGGGASVRLDKQAGMPPEGYALSVDEGGIRIRASGAHGIFNGCMTLLQTARHSFDSSFAFTDIHDAPAMPFRGVRVPFPAEPELPWFLRFADLLARYKINKLLLDIGDPAVFTSVTAENGCSAIAGQIAGVLSARHIEAVPFLRAEANEAAVRAVVSVFGAKLVAARFIRSVSDQDDAAAAEELAERIRKLHTLLAGMGAGLALESAPLHPSTGSRELQYDEATKRNNVLPATCAAADLIPKDILILDANHGGAAEDSGSHAYFASKGFRTVLADCEGLLKGLAGGPLGAYATVSGMGPGALAEGGNRLAAILRTAQLTWAGARLDGTGRGVLLPLDREKEIAQLYPMERDRLEGYAWPSAENPGYRTVDLRGYYNSPLQHSYWRVDDHFMMYLEEAVTLPNSVPFSLFQGVLDFRFGNAFVMPGGSWNKGVTGIAVGMQARSLAFLHAYIFGKQQFIEGMGGAYGKEVGRYAIRFADGSQQTVPVVYGRDICFWKNFHGTNQGAYDANPALMGISPEGLHYTVYASEWVNPRPGVPIVSVDVLPSETMDGRIALFGITAVR